MFLCTHRYECVYVLLPHLRMPSISSAWQDSPLIPHSPSQVTGVFRCQGGLPPKGRLVGKEGAITESPTSEIHTLHEFTVSYLLAKGRAQ